MIINIRGTNGSGKTTLARTLIGIAAKPVDLVQYPAPSKRDPDRVKYVEGWGTPGGFLAVGSYKQGCGGMDTVSSFDLQQKAVTAAFLWESMAGEPPAHVICEGVLASTVAGSWLDYFLGYKNEVIVAYLDTPLELCLERIRDRQRASGRGEREIKTDLVRDKIKAINATRKRFDAAGIRTITLRHDHAAADLGSALV